MARDAGRGWGWAVWTFSSLFFLLAAATPAAAAPVQYNFTTGTATIRADTSVTGTSIVAPTQVPLAGSFIVFDSATIEVVDLLIMIPMTGTIGMANPYGGFDQFVIESASITPGPGFDTLSGTEGETLGTYDFLVFPLDIDGTYGASSTTGPPPPPVTGIEVPFQDNSPLSGTINVGLMTLELNGITLATLLGSDFGEAEDLNIKADIVFDAVLIPEPASAALMALGLVGLVAVRRMRL